MKTKKHIYFYFIIILFIVAGGMFIIKRHLAMKDEIIICESKSKLIHHELVFDSIYRLLFLDNNRGDIELKGVVILDNIEYIVNRHVYFSYKETSGYYLLISLLTEKFSQDSSEKSGIDHHLPIFFSSKGGELSLDLKYDKFGNKIFYLGESPFLYCQTK